MSARRWLCYLGGVLFLSAANAQAQSTGTSICVGGIKAGATCSLANQNTDCAFCDEGVNKGKGCTRAADCAPDGACRGVCESVPNDPVGSPQRYSMFRDDQIWVTSVSGSGLKGDWAQTDSNVSGFTATSLGSGHSFADASAVADSDIAQTRGRFRDAKSDRVLLMYKVTTGSRLQYKVLSPNAGAEPSWQQSGEPGGAIPVWQFDVPTQNPRSPAAIAAGDLDRSFGTDGFFHDEAVIAFEGTDHSVQVQVLDYQRVPGSVTVTPALTVGTLATLATNGTVVPGSLAVGIGDFDGDLNNEIAVLWQYLGEPDRTGNRTRLGLSIVRYVHEAKPPSLQVLHNVTFEESFDGGSYVELPSLELVTGDFDGDFKDEIAFTYVGEPVRSLGSGFYGVLKVMGLDAGFNQNERAEAQLADFEIPAKPYLQDGSFPLGLKPRLTAGLFHYDPSQGFGISRRQLAVLSWLDGRHGVAVAGYEVLGSELVAFPYIFVPEPPDFGVNFEPGTCGVGGSGCTTDEDCPYPVSCRLVHLPRPSLTSGNFSGGDPTTLNGSVPLWFLAVGYSTGTSLDNMQGYVQFLRVTEGGELIPTFRHSSGVAGTQYIVEAYDRNGKSVYVGPPALLTINQLVKPDVIVQEPPKHCDWFGSDGGGKFINVSRQPGLAVTMTDETQTVYKTKTTTSSDWTIGGSIAVTSAGSVGVGDDKVEGVSVGYSASAKVSGSYTEKNEDYNSRSESYDFSVTSATTEDDLVGGSYRTIFIYRYPLIGFALTDDQGKPLTDPSGKPINGFYEIALPGSTGRFQPAGGLNFDSYQPVHENGNVLSYPQISLDAANPVTIPDLGTYSLPGDMVCSNGLKTCAGGAKQGESCDSDGGCPGSTCVDKKCLGDADCKPNTLSNATCDPAPKQQALLNTSYFIDADTQRIRLDIASAVGGGATRTSSGKLAEDADLKVGANATATYDVGTVKVSQSVDVAINNENSWSKLRESEHETTSSTGFLLSKECGEGLPCTTPDKAYQAATAYYYTSSGTQRVMHAVNVTGSSSGQSFWHVHYGVRPDPALNLPQRIVMVENPQSGLLNISNWNDSLYHQRIRGFFVLHGDDPNFPALDGVPFASGVTDGDKVKFQVRVYNYSLVATEHVDVLFVAVPVDASDTRITGDPIPLCEIGTTCPTASLAPLEMKEVAVPWDTTGRGGSSTYGSRSYRIFVILDPDNKIDEIHEWQDRYHFPPTIDGTSKGEPIVDPFTGQREVLESGQNNQGFGEITIYPAPQQTPSLVSGTTADTIPALPPVDVHLDQDALAARSPDGQFVIHDVTATIHHPLHLRVTVKADGPTHRQHHVLLYDDDPDDGKLLGARTLLGIDHVNSSYAWFDWIPRRLGEHQLYARVLEHYDDTSRGNNTTTLTVHVVAPPTPTATSTPTATPTATATVTPTATPSPPTEGDGCTVTGGDATGAWLIFVGVALLLWRQGRRS